MNTLTGSGAATVTGILNSGGTGTTEGLSRNKIYDISSTNASGLASGLTVSSGTTVNVQNNLIGNVTTTAANAANPLTGINISGGTTVNADFNTVYLTGTSSGALFGSSAISVSSTPTVTLRDNIFVNNTTPVGTGLAAAHRRSSTTLTTYGSASNNNDFFASTIYTDGTNTDVGIGAYKTRVASRDSASISENPPFLSTTGSSANFLHIDTTVATQLESGGVPVSGITDDFDGQTRNVSTPDVGADEFNGIALDLTAPVISYTALGNTAGTGSRMLTATITDATGVPIAGAGLPVLYWKINAGGYTAVTASSLGSNQFQFTFGAGVTTGDMVSYYVVAQDTAGTPNVGAFPSAGATGFSANPPAASTPPTTPSSYTILASISGAKTVGSGGDYASLTLAVADLNTKVITGPVVFNLIDPGYTAPQAVETYPITINANGGSSATNTVTIKPSAPGVTMTGSSASGLIVLNGADYVILDGSSNGTSSRDLTMTNTNSGTSSAVVWMQTAGGPDGATNNVVKNLNLVGNSNTTTLFGVGAGSSTISTTSLGTGNNSNTIQNNNISKTQYGIYSQGASAAAKNTGNIITQNLINTVTPNNVSRGGIWVGFENGVVISSNTVDGINQTSSPDVFGITLGFGTAMSATTSAGNEVTNATVSRNIVGSVINSGTFSAYGIGLSAATSGTSTIVNNVVYGVAANGTSGDFGGGIVLGGGLGSTTNVYFNSVSFSGTITGATAASQTAACLAVTTSTAPTLDIRDNVFSNTQLGNTSATLRFVAIALGYSSTTGNYAGLTSNFNDLYSAGAGPGTYAVANTGTVVAGTARTTLADWTTETGRDGSSISANPLFNSATNLQPQLGSPVLDTGTSLSGTVTPYVDITGATRVDPPSMGAYEAGVDVTGPAIAYTPLVNTTSTAARNLTATITDASGVPASGAGLPVLYWRISAGAYTAATATSLGSNQYQFTFGAGVATSDTVSYYIVAQDSAPTPNVSVSPAAGASGLSANPPAASTPPTTPSSYTIVPFLSGTRTVGTGGDYANLTAAVTALNNSELNGPVVFTLLNESFTAGPQTPNATGEVFPITINANPGSSASNTITIKPASAATVTMTGTAGAAAVIKINGADYVTIDGSNNGTSSQDLTITSANSAGVVVWIGSASASDGASNNTIKNVKLVGTATTGTIAGVIAGSGTTFGNAAEAANSNNTIQNCVATKVQNAAYLVGNGTTFDQNWMVLGNTFGSTVVADKLGFRGLLIGNAQDFVISGNTINGVVSSTSSSSTMTGIQMAFAVNGGAITANKISDIKQINTTGWGSNGIYLAQSSTTANVTVANNFISDIASQGFNGVTSSDNGYGIMIDTGAGYKIYANTVNLNTNQTSSSGITAALNIAAAVTTAGGIDLRDNILASAQTNGTRYAVYDGSTAAIFSSINYNDYFAQNVGFLTSARATLANWQTATGQDLNSISANPGFVSATDLHLALNTSPAANAGAPLAAVTIDIDGHSRSATKPDIGADEIASNNLSNLTLSMGSLTPAFDPATIDYTASVSNSISSITVTPTVLDSNAIVTVNGNAVTSGSPSGNIPLMVGNNTITVVVSPEFGPFAADQPNVGTTKTYTVVVNRAAATYTVTYDGNNNTGGTAP
ncbi:MAG: cadherin-like beta sandwich domain-containing protein, partial [Planctomycetota bacterium]